MTQDVFRPLIGPDVVPSSGPDDEDTVRELNNLLYDDILWRDMQCFCFGPPRQYDSDGSNNSDNDSDRSQRELQGDLQKRPQKEIQTMFLTSHRSNPERP